MTLTTALAAAVTLAAGAVGALTAYQVAAPEPTAAPAAQPAEQRSGPERPRFAPCEKPAKLERGRCVTTVTREVTLPGQAAAAPAPAPAPAPPAPGSGDDLTSDPGLDARRDLSDDLDEVEDDYDDDGFDDDGWDTGHTGTGTQTRTRTRTGDERGDD